LVNLGIPALIEDIVNVAYVAPKQEYVEILWGALQGDYGIPATYATQIGTAIKAGTAHVFQANRPMLVHYSGNWRKHFYVISDIELERSITFRSLGDSYVAEYKLQINRDGILSASLLFNDDDWGAMEDYLRAMGLEDLIGDVLNDFYSGYTTSNPRDIKKLHNGLEMHYKFPERYMELLRFIVNGGT